MARLLFFGSLMDKVCEKKIFFDFQSLEVFNSVHVGFCVVLFFLQEKKFLFLSFPLKESKNFQFLCVQSVQILHSKLLAKSQELMSSENAIRGHFCFCRKKKQGKT